MCVFACVRRMTKKGLKRLQSSNCLTWKQRLRTWTEARKMSGGIRKEIFQTVGTNLFRAVKCIIVFGGWVGGKWVYSVPGVGVTRGVIDRHMSWCFQILFSCVPDLTRQVHILFMWMFAISLCHGGTRQMVVVYAYKQDAESLSLNICS